MSSLAVQPVPPPPEPMRQFSVDEFHRMIDAGILGEDERVELLEGWLVAKMVHNPRHDAMIDSAREAIQNRVPSTWRVRVQSAITTDDSEPEPDLAVVIGPASRYKAAHPRPSDVGLIVEVADSSIRLDRGLKLRLYARAQIATYWIINLQDRCVEVYTDPTGPTATPDYRGRNVVVASAKLPLPQVLQPSGDITLAELFD